MTYVIGTTYPSPGPKIGRRNPTRKRDSKGRKVQTFKRFPDIQWLGGDAYLIPSESGEGNYVLHADDGLCHCDHFAYAHECYHRAGLGRVLAMANRETLEEMYARMSPELTEAERNLLEAAAMVKIQWLEALEGAERVAVYVRMIAQKAQGS